MLRLEDNVHGKEIRISLILYTLKPAESSVGFFVSLWQKITIFVRII